MVGLDSVASEISWGDDVMVTDRHVIRLDRFSKGHATRLLRTEFTIDLNTSTNFGQWHN